MFAMLRVCIYSTRLRGHSTSISVHISHCTVLQNPNKTYRLIEPNIPHWEVKYEGEMYSDLSFTRRSRATCLPVAHYFHMNKYGE